MPNKPSNLTVVQADLGDIPGLCELLALLFNQEAEFKPDAGLQAQGLKEIIENPERGRILVLRDQAQLIGMVNLLFTVSTALGGKVALLEDLVVRPDCRGTGAGSTLLQAALDWAKSSGCRRITLLTDADNDSGQRFYQRHGFCLSGMRTMRLLL